MEGKYGTRMWKVLGTARTTKKRGSGGSGKSIAGSSERNESAEDSDKKAVEATIEVSLSELTEAAGNLFRFNLPIITKRRSLVRSPTNPTAYTLWDCGGSHMFVHPELISRLRTAGYAIMTRRRGQLDLVTAGRRERLPLHEARLGLDIGGLQYSGWFVIYILAKYDAILGKSWMEVVPHRVDLGRNILRQSKDTPGRQFKFKLHGLPKDKGRRDWPDLGTAPLLDQLSRHEHHRTSQERATPRDSRLHGGRNHR